MVVTISLWWWFVESIQRVHLDWSQTHSSHIGRCPKLDATPRSFMWAPTTTSRQILFYIFITEGWSTLYIREHPLLTNPNPGIVFICRKNYNNIRCISNRVMAYGRGQLVCMRSLRIALCTYFFVLLLCTVAHLFMVLLSLWLVRIAGYFAPTHYIQN